MTRRKQKTIQRKSSFTDKLRTPQQNLLYKCLIFGPSRSGKTTFAGSAGLDVGRAGPVLILDFEGGTGSTAGFPNVQIAEMRDWKDFNEAAEYIYNEDHRFKPDRDWETCG